MCRIYEIALQIEFFFDFGDRKEIGTTPTTNYRFLMSNFTYN